MGRAKQQDASLLTSGRAMAEDEENNDLRKWQKTKCRLSNYRESLAGISQ